MKESSANQLTTLFSRNVCLRLPKPCPVRCILANCTTALSASVLWQGVMTKRILGLLWRISLASQMHAPLDMTLCFADVLRDYALTSKSADTQELALDYVSQLVQELNGIDKALPAMRVLTHLIANSGNHAVSPALPPTADKYWHVVRGLHASHCCCVRQPKTCQVTRVHLPARPLSLLSLLW